MSSINLATATGLELMQAMLAGTIPMAAIAKVVPMQGVSVSEGALEFSARADDTHTNPLGGVHGGFAATVLDSVTGCVTHTVLGAGISYSTIDLHVKMLRPVPKFVPLKATGKVLSHSTNIVVAEGFLHDPEGRLLAHATSTCMTLRPRANKTE
jgi:uncharacterized protein (TIGR00369 family)